MPTENQIRLERKNGFTVLQNDLIRDRRLSLKTKGLFAVLASLPPGWDYSVRGLCKIADVGAHSVKAALSELEEAGYLERIQNREGGKFASCTYVIHDVSAKPREVTPENSNLPPLVENQPTADIASPLADFPTAVFPLAENLQQVNKELNKERNNNTPYSPPSGDGERRHRSPKSMPEWKPDRFEGLWNFYPKQGKKDRVKAVREWDKLKPDDALIDQIAHALVRQKASDEWQRGIGIPYLCRYLSHQRWKDEISQTAEAAGCWAEDREVV